MCAITYCLIIQINTRIERMEGWKDGWLDGVPPSILPFIHPRVFPPSNTSTQGIVRIIKYLVIVCNG